MSNVPEGILCSKTHEWVLDNGDNTYTVGLTDYAVEQLGDIVFVELPEVGSEYQKDEFFATIESVMGKELTPKREHCSINSLGLICPLRIQRETCRKFCVILPSVSRKSLKFSNIPVKTLYVADSL